MSVASLDPGALAPSPPAPPKPQDRQRGSEDRGATAPSIPLLPARLLEPVALRFGQLASPTRLRLLAELYAAGERSVSELAGAAGLPVPSASHNLRWLTVSGITARRREGTHILYRIVDPVILALLGEIVFAETASVRRRVAASASLSFDDAEPADPTGGVEHSGAVPPLEGEVVR
jgi:DNA-binding transcriptional ArsR family regulator